MGAPLFSRRYQLTIAPNLSSQTAFQYGNIDADMAPLRITFDIKKTDKPPPNPAHVVIFNLSEKTRQSIKPGWALRLQAGYKDIVQDLWVGQVGKGIAARGPDLSVGDKASTKREGSDISYAIESADGLGPLTYAHMDASYGAGTLLEDVFTDIKTILTKSTPATSFGVSIGSIPNPSPLAGAKVKRSLHIHGNIQKALNMLFHPIGHDWFVLNNELCVVPSNGHSQDPVPVISAASGLIGIPSREDNDIVTITTLLNPQLAPGRLLQLKSADGSFNGYYKVRQVQHRGDTHGDQWESEVQCMAYGANPDATIETPEVEATA